MPGGLFSNLLGLYPQDPSSSSPAVRTKNSLISHSVKCPSLLLLSCFSHVQLCDPKDGSPPGSPGPWDFPGKNTEVGCHFLPQCMKVKSNSEVTHSCPTLRPHGLQPTRLLHPWDFPGKNTGVGCHLGKQKPLPSVVWDSKRYIYF